VGTATLGAGDWGQLDLAGNVWEWSLDWFGTSYVDPCVDCAYLTATSGRAVPGGDYGIPASGLNPSYRGGNDPQTTRYGSVGIRCARTP
jgi:formylglycine-generating enzyme required for sulfatase activity